MKRAPVTLRPANASDIEIFYTHQLDSVSTDLAKVYARSREAFDAHWDAILSNPNTIARTILYGDEVVGLINTFPVKDERHIGYWIDRAHWGRGIASCAIARMVEVDPPRPLHAVVAIDNVGSMKALERSGFVRIGEEHSGETERYMACVVVRFELR
ncbi:MAG: GNAT family N-acetyltransferase [Phycisphaerales bacterium]|nr:GNAT family N-acetyltransferase [Phycisphaerales bacterium]